MREVLTRARLSPRVVAVCIALGLSLRRPDAARPAHTTPSHRAAAAQLAATIRASRGGLLVCVTGPSGGGKSTLLRTLARRLRATVVRAGRGTRDAAVDVVRGGSASLARAGLADGPAMVRSACELSEGQRHRLHIACAMSQRSRVVLLDEFASNLDRPSAQGVAMGLHRWARACRKAVVCATAHDDVVAWLRADVVVRVPLEGPIEFEPSG